MTLSKRLKNTSARPNSKLFFLLLLCSFAFHTAQAETVRIPGETGHKHKLADQLIIRVLQRGGVYDTAYPYGDIDTLPLSTRVNDMRTKELDVFFALSTPEYEQEFLPIYFPIYRGMLGMRLAIVKKESVELFSQVRSLADLKRFKAGQGALWADVKILEANGLTVIKELTYTNLFRMLEADRFDYFPRGISEPWLEVQREHALNLTVDPYIVIQYKAPFYFFVHRSNPALAEHIREQLEEMLADGSYMKLFYENDEIKMAIHNSNLNQRTVIQLQNPYLSQQTPVDRKNLWFTPDELNHATQTPGVSP